MVLAVGDEDDDAAVALLRVAREGQQGLFQRLADGRALHRYQRRVDPPCEGPGHAVVRGDRQLDLGFAREDDQSHAVLLQPLEEFADGVFGPFETVGFEIFGQHRVRNVDREHHFDALGFLLAEFRTELRARRSQYDQRDGGAEKDEPESRAPGRYFGHQLLQNAGAAEACEPSAAVAGRQPVERDERRDGQQQPEILRICETEHN